MFTVRSNIYKILFIAFVVEPVGAAKGKIKIIIFLLGVEFIFFVNIRYMYENVNLTLIN